MRLFLSFFSVFLAFSWLCPIPAFASPPRELIIFTWADYFDPELQHKFEKKFSAKVTFIYFSSDENRTQQLVEENTQGFDLILTSGIDLGSYVKKGWLAPLQTEEIPNLEHLSRRWRTAFPAAESYAIPFLWGTMGIVYRTDLVTTPITSWRQLFQPDEELSGRIGMMSDSRELVSMALKSLGYSANSENRQQLKEAEELLIAQKKHVKSYLYMSLEKDSSLVRGDLIATMAYSGDALMLREHSDQLAYVLPEEGGNIWVDYFVLGAEARNPGLAHQFLNFINQPENAAQLAAYTYSATPNQAAEALLPKEFLANPIIYPGAKGLQLSEFHAPLAPRIQRLRNNIGARILR